MDRRASDVNRQRATRNHGARYVAEPLERRSLLAAISWGGALREVVDDQWVVHVAGLRGNGADRMSQFNTALNLNADYEAVDWLGSDGLFLLKSPRGQSLMSVVNDLMKLPGVDHVQPNFVLHGDVIPNDTSFGSLWGLHNTGQSGGTVDADIDAPEAWDVSTGSDSVVAAVLDSGINYNHPDLNDNVWRGNANHGWDFVNNDSDPMDDNGHGTHVAGTIGAEGNSASGVAGVNWDIQLMAVKVLNASNSGTTAGVVSGINWITSQRNAGVNVRVINMSIGMNVNNVDIPCVADPTIRNAIVSAGNAGILFVASAGNSAHNVDPDLQGISLPSNLIHVAATNRQDNLASFSNYGNQTVHVAAPGLSILSTVLGTSYSSMSGTSMAAPHVAGVAALLSSASPGLTVADLKNRILGGVDVRASLSGKVSTGGRLNAANALPVPNGIWDGGGDGANWTDPLNWSNNTLPGSNEDVIINVTAAPAITLASGTQAVRSLTCSETLTISGGALSIANSSAITGVFTLSGGTLLGAGNATVGGTMNWTGGTMSGNGITTISNTAQLVVSGPNTKTLSRQLVNNGSATWSDGQIDFSNGSFSNTGSFIATANGHNLYARGLAGGNLMSNAGEFQVTGQNGYQVYFIALNVPLAFNNSGFITISNNNSLIVEGGSHSGAVSLTDGSDLQLFGGFGATTFAATSVISGTGDLTVWNDAQFGGPINLAGTFRVSGTATCTAPVSASALTVAGGTLLFHSEAQITAFGVIIGGTIGGNADVTFGGFVSWSGGTMAGMGKTIINAGGTLSIDAGSAKALSRIIESRSGGQITWNAGVTGLAGGAFVNKSGGTVSLATGPGAFSYSSGAGATFTNEAGGNVVKTGDGLFVFDGSIFNNHGSMNHQEGTLDLKGGGTHTGPFVIGANAGIRLFDVPNSFSSSATIGNGTGGLGAYSSSHTFGGPLNLTTLGVSDGSAVFNGTVSASKLAMGGGTAELNAPTSFGPATSDIDGGTLTGTADVVFAGPLNWTGGTMRGSGSTLIASTGTLNIDGSGVKTLSRPFLNSGSVVLHGGGSLAIGPNPLTNNGTFSVSDGSGITAPSVPFVSFLNAGTFTKTGSGTTSAVAFPVEFRNGGSVEVSSGTLEIGNYIRFGSVHVAGGATLRPAYMELATLTVDGTVQLITGSPLNPDTVTGHLNISASGSLDLANHRFSLPSGAVANVAGSVTGSHNLTVAGTCNWTAGAMTGTGKTIISSGGMLDIGGMAVKTLSRQLQIQSGGSGSWSGGDVNFLGGTFTNSGTLALGTSNAIPLSGTNVFVNNGNLSVQAGATFANDVSLTNAGTMTAAGAYNQRGGAATASGKFEAALGGSIRFNGSSYALPAGSELKGAGYFTFLGAAFVVDSTITAMGPMRLLTINAQLTCNTPVALGTGLVGVDVNSTGTFNSPVSADTVGVGANSQAIFNGDVTTVTYVASSSGSLLEFNGSRLSTGLIIVETGGNMKVLPGGNRVARVSSVSITGGGSLDLADNDLIIDYSSVSPVGIWTGSTYDGVTGYVKTGRSNGAWNGTGIITSMAGAGDLTTLGIAEASQALSITGTETGVFSGQTLDSTAVLVKFTWGGDANLDGKINIDDYGQIDFNVGSSGSIFGWFNGDYNFDGKINIDDYGIIDYNVASQDKIL